MNVYELAVPSGVARAEWDQFARDENLIRSIGDVRFDAVAADRTRLAITGGDNASAADAVVQRFRERLARKRLIDAWHSEL